MEFYISIFKYLIFFSVFAFAGAKANQEMNDKNINLKQYLWSKKWRLAIALALIIGSGVYGYYTNNQFEKLHPELISDAKR